MTPLDIAQFSELLRDQMDQVQETHDLTISAPIFKVMHPGIIRTRLDHQNASNWTRQNVSHGFYFAAFESEEEARKCLPVSSPLKKGTPTVIRNFMQDQIPALVIFQDIGIAYISNEALPFKDMPNETLATKLIQTWLDYALSPELWGPEGKWTRFHSRLHGLFKKFDLLIEGAQPGYYLLKPNAAFLKKYGFFGDEDIRGYALTFPWDFPLSALVKLEKCIEQEL